MTRPGAVPLSQIRTLTLPQERCTIVQFQSCSPARVAWVCIQGKTSEPDSRVGKVPQIACFVIREGKNPNKLLRPLCSFSKALYKMEVRKGQHLEECNRVGAL